MPHLEPQHLAVVHAILDRHVPGLDVQAFGSRVAGTHCPASDLDLVLMTTTALPFATMTSLREAFVDSDLPFPVDVVDWSTLSAEFRRVIQEQAVPFR